MNESETYANWFDRANLAKFDGERSICAFCVVRSRGMKPIPRQSPIDKDDCPCNGILCRIAQHPFVLFFQQYGGFYKHNVDNVLCGAERLFQLMGYVSTGHDSLCLPEGTPIDQVHEQYIFSDVKCLNKIT